MMSLPRPTDAELDAYQRGMLDDEHFARVDAWLSEQEDKEGDAELDQLIDHQLPIVFDPQAKDMTVHMPFLGRANTFHPQHLHDRFRLERRLGRGGMGTVDAVWDRLLERPVAIKRCRPRLPDESPHRFLDRVARFRREARLTAALEHPGVVPVHDIGHDGSGAPAYVMSRIDGLPLDEHLRLHGGGVTQAVRVVMRVAETIAFAHNQGVVHRDLTPRNIVIGPFGDVVVIDWGLAAHVGDQHAGACGTPGWAPPEQLQGAAPDPRMDVWGLAALLVYACTGEPPYPENSDIALARPSTNFGLLGQMPVALSALVRHCLSRDPHQRSADGSAFVAELQRWLQEGLTQAQQPRLHHYAWSLLRRHWALATAAVCLLGLLCVIAMMVMMSIREGQRMDRIRITRVMSELPFSDREGLRLLAGELEDVARGMYRASPELIAAQEAVGKAQAVLEHSREQAHLEALFREHEMRYRRSGPWQGELQQRVQLLRRAGLQLSPQYLQADKGRLLEHELREQLIIALIQARRAQVADGQTGDEDWYYVVHHLLSQARLDDAWSGAVNLVLQASAAPGGAFMAWPQVGVDEALYAIRDDRAAAAVIMTMFYPDERLRGLAQHRLADSRGAFWPRITLSRLEIAQGNWSGARDHALVAFGADDRSMWPPLLLSFIALQSDRAEHALLWAQRGRQRAPDNIYLLTLHAAALAALGQRKEAQEMIAMPGLAGHYQYHLFQESQTFLAKCIEVLQEGGVKIPLDPPRRMPTLVPSDDARD